MKKELPKTYNPADYEELIYKKWEKSGFLNPDNLQGEPYSIMMPPPNVTGVLHLGHALENSLMDIMARYQRMNGKKVLLLPGTDHAALPTQAKVEKLLWEKGITNPRLEFGREKLVAEIRKFAEASKATILSQIKKIGTSCDWSRLAYTFDEKRNLAVNTVFTKMYNDGLIYRGKRIINWDAKLQTTISDDEIVWQEEKVPFYYLQYGPFVIATARPETKFGDKYVVMHPDDKRYKKYKHGDKFDCEWINGQVSATVIKDEAIDPKFGTGVMTITPWHDMVDFEIAERHKLNGEQIIDFNGKLLPIAGEFVGLDILSARPKIVEKLKAKGLVVKIEENYLHRVAKGDRSNSAVEPQIKEQWFVAVNKIISGKKKSLKDLMREAVTTGYNGDAEQKVKITPERFEKIYLHWIDNLRDWCISRQIWWGHRIPVYYRKSEIFNFQFSISNEVKQKKLGFHSSIVPELLNGKRRTYRIHDHNLAVGDQVAMEDSGLNTLLGYASITGVQKLMIGQIALPDMIHSGKYKTTAELIQAFKRMHPEEKNITKNTPAFIYDYDFSPSAENNQEIYVGLEAPKGKGWIQDEDTLDTWFSSGLWTFSTLGWPGKTKDLKTFHPTSWMQMGYEILFFWMARMILMSTYILDQIPFKDVYIHGMLRSETGKKFSKSSGNNIDPLEVIAKFGTDALRLSVMSGIAPGNDSKFYEEKVEGARNLVNKFWNISRYIITNYELGIIESKINGDDLSVADLWVVKKMQDLIIGVKSNLDNYEFSQAIEKLKEFTWDILADWYVEISKFEEGNKNQILIRILPDLLKLWHPFMPFITEVIWEEMKGNNLLMMAEFPKSDYYTKIIKSTDKTYYFELIKDVITVIRNARAENKVEPARKVKAVIYAGAKRDLLMSQVHLIKNLRTSISELEIKAKGEKIADAIYAAVGEIEIYLLGAVDSEKEKVRLEKEIANLEKVIKANEGKLANEEFVAKAPEAVVKKEREKLAGWQEELKKIKEQIKHL